MASNTSNWYSISGHSARKYRAYVNAYVQSETDTTATIYVEGCVQAYYMSSYGAGVGVYINGQWVDGASVAIFNSSGDVGNWGWASGTLTISKSSSAKSITCTCSVWGETVSGCGGVNGGDPSASVAVPMSAITYYAPNAPSDLTNTRESDNKNVLGWTAPTTSTTKPVSAILIERQVDGGEWSQIASVGGSATSYNDTTTFADHSYAYRIRSQNTAGYSDYATSETTYNTPAAPTKVVAARLAETTVSLAVTNASNTATALEVQRSTDASTWESVATVSGSPVTETTDEPGGGTFYYRARNTRGDLVSEWSSASNAVVTICAPNAPSLVSPASGSVVSKASDTVTFKWTHNPIDGSAQTAAKLRYSTDGGSTYTEVAIADSASSYSMSNSFAVNAQVTWSVCTKGAHADYGPWSDNRVFYVYQAPSVAFTAPADGFTVENTPIEIALQYDDASGTLASATLSVSDGSKTVYTRNMGTATECEILATEWLPDNDKDYVLTATVRSSSSLTASATREIAVSFVLPQAAGVHVGNDPETGYATLSVYVEDSEDLEAAASVSVWRECDGERVLLGEGLQAGAAVVDKYAPLNEGYSYIVTSFADSGAANSTAFDNLLSTNWAFLYFADGGIARGMWNPEDSWKLNQEVDYVQYIGREHPVAYMRDAMEETHSVTVTLMDREEMRAFRKMMSSHEPVVAKLWDALVFHAVPQVNGKPAATVSSYWGEVAVNLTRIDGEAL